MLLNAERNWQIKILLSAVYSEFHFSTSVKLLPKSKINIKMHSSDVIKIGAVWTSSIMLLQLSSILLSLLPWISAYDAQLQPSQSISYSEPVPSGPSYGSAVGTVGSNGGYGPTYGADRGAGMPANVFQQQLPLYSFGRPPQNIPTASSCYVDLKCFSCSPGFSIAQGFPFERRTPITCEDCLQLCLEKQSAEYPYCCRAVVYDFAYRTCDLFAVDGKSQPQIVTKYETRSYFVPTGQCGAKKEPEKEAAALCKEGELPKIIEISGYTDPDAKEAISLSGYTLKDCATACLDNKDAEGKPLEIEGACASLIYEGTTCKLDDMKIEYLRNLQPSADSTYMMVQCFPEKLVSQCPNNFIYAPGHVLVGFAKTVITTSSESECVEKCLTSTEDLGFYCKSGMFYQEDRNENCILNTESRSTQPNVYTEDEAAVMYFELGCGRSGRRLSKKFYKNFSQALFDLPAAGLWTQWSPCATTDGSSIRYRACREKDIRNCPKEVKSCSNAQKLPMKPAAGRFPDGDLRKRKKDEPVLKRQ
ncbi:Uncharacterized protein T03_9557 [Trichinella britovi]|uniref:Apple domain-containing protein n=1 Tax=Trichinella britovi TaxID=45882 RepID=A0A0V1D321_TRIBR|nr:Uncharacterized protein T03_9557 [Trichinella britovi]